jgi:hypothetical protein
MEYTCKVGKCFVTYTIQYRKIGKQNKTVAVILNTPVTGGHGVEATSMKIVGSNPDEVTGFFNWPNPSSRNTTLGSTQLLTEMSTRNLPERNVRLARRADNLTAICVLTV